MDVERSTVGGEILKAAREAAEIKLTVMAARTHFSIGHLSNVESGRRAASADVVAAYERELGGPVDRRSFLALPAAPALARMAADAERAFTHTESDANRADRVADQVEARGRESVVTASTEMLGQLITDFDGIRLLLDRTRSPKIQSQLYRSAALTAALTADALMVLGDKQNAYAWSSVGATAARESGDRGAASTIAGLGSLIALYYGDLGEVLTRTHASVRQAGPTAALAQTVQALAHARLGDHEAARTALTAAESRLNDLQDSGGNSVFGFTERRFLIYKSRTLLHLGHLTAAEEAQNAALGLYPSTAIGDPTLIRLDKAAVMARSGDVHEATAYAIDVLNAVPVGRRALIYLDHAVNVIAGQDKTRSAVRDYQDTLSGLRRSFS